MIHFDETLYASSYTHTINMVSYSIYMPSFTWKHSDTTVPIAKDIENNRILFMNKSEDYEEDFANENRDFEVSDLVRNRLSTKRLDLLRKHLI